MEVRLGERPVEGDVAADARALASQGRDAIGDLGVDEQRIDVEQVEEIGILGDARAIVGHHPDAVRAKDAEDGLERDHRVAAQHACVRTRREAVRDQHAGDGMAARRRRVICQRGARGDHAGPVVRDARAPIEVVDHPHGISAAG